MSILIGLLIINYIFVLFFPKTFIRIIFSQLDKSTYQEYMSHFKNNEDVYSYFSPLNQTMITKKFFITRPQSSMLYGSDTKQRYDEFEVLLKQCGEA